MVERDLNHANGSEASVCNRVQIPASPLLPSLASLGQSVVPSPTFAKPAVLLSLGESTHFFRYFAPSVVRELADPPEPEGFAGPGGSIPIVSLVAKHGSID